MLRVAIFGGPSLYGAVKAPRPAAIAHHPYKAIGFKLPPVVASSGAALQLLRFCTGELGIPDRVRELCYADPEPAPAGERLLPMARCDLALIQLSTPIELVYRGFVLKGNHVRDRFAAEVGRRFPEFGEAVARWRAGLQKMNEEARLAAAGELLASLPPAECDDDLFIRDVIERTRARRNGAAEICRDIAALHARLPIPLGMVLSDGGDAAGDFRNDCRQAARLLRIRVLDPGDSAAIADGFHRFVRDLLDRPTAGDTDDVARAAFARPSGDLLDRRAA